MLGIPLEVCGVMLGTLLAGYIAVQVYHSTRRLNRRIQEFKAEQEEMQKQGVPLNPYAAIAELYAEDNRDVKYRQPKRPSQSGHRRFRFRSKG